MTETTQVIHTPFIRLDGLLKLAGLAQTGGQAKWMVFEGQVKVGGEICLQRGRKLYPGDRMETADRAVTVRAAD